MVRTSSFSSYIRYQRKAFTMIELIFAIVVLAVVMLTIPMMIQVNNKGLEGSTNQEAIILASSALSYEAAYIWDDNSYTSGSQDVTMSVILDVPTGHDDYNRTDVNSSTRIGGLQEDLHRHFGDNATLTPLQAAGAPVPFTPPVSTFDQNSSGYKFGYTVTGTKSYINDDPTSFVFSDVNASDKTNIKLIEIEVNDATTGEIVTLLRTYTCNIGEIDFAKRRIP